MQLGDLCPQSSPPSPILHMDSAEMFQMFLGVSAAALSLAHNLHGLSFLHCLIFSLAHYCFLETSQINHLHPHPALLRVEPIRVIWHLVGFQWVFVDWTDAGTHSPTASLGTVCSKYFSYIQCEIISIYKPVKGIYNKKNLLSENLDLLIFIKQLHVIY